RQLRCSPLRHHRTLPPQSFTPYVPRRRPPNTPYPPPAPGATWCHVVAVVDERDVCFGTTASGRQRLADSVWPTASGRQRLTDSVWPTASDRQRLADSV